MIKKVKVEDLKIGVYIHDFNCNGNDGLIYIDQNLFKNENVIDILKSWNIREVYIDTEKGLDVNSLKAPSKAGRETAESGQMRKVERPQVPLAQELQSAKHVTQDAIQFMQRMNQQVIEGKLPDVHSSYDLANRMYESINRNRDALLLLTRMRTKDEYTLYHSINVSSLVINMCNYCQVSESQTLDLAVGALFHDIGKAVVPQGILTKPARLTQEEYSEMQLHVEHSAKLLSQVKGLPLECYDIALHHHERYDGNGYPHGLKKNEISYAAQLTGVCDVYDAITSDRCYKLGMDAVVGLTEIYEGSGISFSKEITYDFIQSVGIYPVGTTVVLANGKSGVVVSSTEDMMRPIVQVIYDEKKKERIQPLKIDLSKTEDVIVSYGDPKKFGFTSKQLLKKFLYSQS
ncbi:MAG: HD-GYP domain-containing protein [Desulfocapsaceae bacterium]|nr:HD-GYP domain-containing protein [Desulfocapsaceae bacterium]